MGHFNTRLVIKEDSPGSKWCDRNAGESRRYSIARPPLLNSRLGADGCSRANRRRIWYTRFWYTRSKRWGSRCRALGAAQRALGACVLFCEDVDMSARSCWMPYGNGCGARTSRSSISA